ncbi:MAG: MoxR family ATPase [Methylophilaceae bacterium]
MQNLTNNIIAAVKTVILGKDEQIKLALSCILASGHLLIEDQPGMGKTTLAHTLARVLGLNFQRVQFTSDLLPADILGISVYDRNASSFKFHPGAVFTNVLLADEINRATPKTQSALLEVMEEAQVTVDRVTYPLLQPFFVIATQNPTQHLGTFPLPESQLDRFLMRISLGYPDHNAERALLKNAGGRAIANQISPVCDANALLAIQQQVRNIHTNEKLLDYLQAVVEYSRAQFSVGLSPRSSLGLLQAARAWAMLSGRDYAIPEDVQAVLPSVVEHRLQGNLQTSVAQQILSHVAIA